MWVRRLPGHSLRKDLEVWPLTVWPYAIKPCAITYEARDAPYVDASPLPRRVGRYRQSGLASLLGAQFEAASLVLLVPLAKLIAAGESSYRGKLGPFTLDVGANELALLVAASVVFAALASVFVAWRSAASPPRGNSANDDASSRAISRRTTRRKRRNAKESWRRSALTRTPGGRVLGAITYGIRAGLNLAVFVTAAVVLDYRTAFAIFVMGFILFSVLRPLAARIRRYNSSLADVQVAYNQHLSETSRLAREIRVYQRGVNGGGSPRHRGPHVSLDSSSAPCSCRWRQHPRTNTQGFS